VTVFSERPLPSLARDGSLLPEGWTEVDLDEIVVHAIGGEWGEPEEKPGLEKVSVIRGTEFRDWARERGATAAERWIRRSRLAKRLLQAGDLIVEISGGGPEQPVGRTLCIDEEAIRRAKSPLVCSNFCRLMRIHPAIDPAYVQLAIQDKYLRGEIADYQTQTTNLRNLDFAGFLAGTVLRLAPRPEQERIVERVEELLAGAQRARERLQRARAVIKRFRQSVLADATSGRLTEPWRERQAAVEPSAAALRRVVAARREDWAAEVRRAEAERRRPPKPPADLASWQAPEPLPVPEVPEGWSLVPLRTVVRTLQYGTSVRAAKTLQNGVPVLRMGNIQDGALDLSDIKVIDPGIAKIALYRLCRGDILFNRTNSPELVGKAAVFDHDFEAVFASYLVRIGCDERLVSSRYVCAWINSPWGRRWARTVRTDCVSQSNINAAKLQTMPVPVPPLAEQEEIVRRIEALFDLADAIEGRLRAAWAQVERLPRTILERAFRGELVPTEAELARDEGRQHEPAALLIERVRSARELERRPRLEALPRLRSAGKSALAAEALAAFRQACWGATAMNEGELLRRVAVRLGSVRSERLEPGELAALLETALERRIVYRAGDLILGATPKFARYADDFLLSVIRALLAGRESDRRTLTREVAAHLGYSQITVAMCDRMEEVFEEGIRRGLLVAHGSRLTYP